ncbi:hypothetical protein EIN_485490 [Entamoeba invadens IP1]|uniref:Rap-GAP domain-containing protein n=1 Tax=Entamoeba invadens IP1 TaxID=370355 RepID=A0A0A1U4G6_ENTIV|nr:hypothetical protein EIN_485490 [Entamoeba invadens IP1]ELP89157.1 hypothetical protein EIN_485490 [Entamoeba invadens IP1]|eukprot:XP_004255928.1 hypothetical protein EIN_485490 [Entamoeba invadens IP1]
MLSPTVKTTELLTQPANTNVTAFLQSTVEYDVVRLVVNNISTRIVEASAQLPTDDHCKWVMEVIGKGLSFPYSEIETISTCLGIYENWFSEEMDTPQPIKANTKHYTEIFLGQMSMLYTRRVDPCSPQTLIKYAELCLRGLVALRKVSERVSDPETLRRLVVVLMGSIDDVCGPDDNLCTQLPMSKVVDVGIVILYQQFTRLGTTEANIWNFFMRRHSIWVRINEVATNWARYVMLIQTALFKWLYSEVGGDTVEVFVTFNKTTVQTTFKKTYAFRFWLRVLHLVGNLTLIQDNKVFCVVQQGINELILDIINFQSKQPLPNGNDILNIFIDALYQPIHFLDHNKYSEGIIVIVKSTTQIVRKLLETTIFETKHNVKLLKIFQCALLSANMNVVEAAVQLTAGFFNEKTPTFALLYPALNVAINQCVSKSQPNFKECAIKLIEEVQLSIGRERLKYEIPHLGGNNDVITFADVKQKLVDDALQAFENESKSDILKLLIGVFSRFVMDAVETGNVTEMIAKVIKCFTQTNSQLTLLLTTECNDLINFLETLIEYSSFCENPPNALYPLFNFLLTFIDNKKQDAPCYNYGALVNTFVKIYTCCFEIIEPTVFTKCNQTLAVLARNITLERLPQIETFFDARLANCFDDYVLPIMTLQTAIDEVQIRKSFVLNGNDSFEDYIHIYSQNCQILTFIEIPWANNKHTNGVICISRTQYGKKCFFFRYVPDADNEDWGLFLSETAPVLSEQTPLAITETDWKLETPVNVADLVTSAEEDVKTIENSDARLKAPLVITQEFLRKNRTLSKSGMTRLLLRMLDITHITNPFKTTQPTNAIYSVLHELDNMSTKNKVLVDITCETGATKEFVSFVNRLGDVIITDVSKIMKYEDDTVEMVFSTPLITKPREALVPLVHVVWNGTEKPNDETTISILPTTSDLYVLDSITTDVPSQKLVHLSVLPLVIHAMIMRLVRKTILPLNPIIARKDKIVAFHEKTCDVQAFVDVLFTRSWMNKMQNQNFEPKTLFNVSVPEIDLPDPIKVTVIEPVEQKVETPKKRNSLEEKSIAKKHKSLWNRKSSANLKEEKQKEKEEKQREKEKEKEEKQSAKEVKEAKGKDEGSSLIQQRSHTPAMTERSPSPSPRGERKKTTFTGLFKKKDPKK